MTKRTFELRRVSCASMSNLSPETRTSARVFAANKKSSLSFLTSSWRGHALKYAVHLEFPFGIKIDLQLASGPPRTTRTSFGARGNQSSTIPAKLFFVAKATFPPGGLSRILLTIISNSRILSCLKIQQKKEQLLYGINNK